MDTSTSANPFAPPQAAVADVAEQGEQFQPVKIFSLKGRIGRLRFLAYSTGSNLVIYFLAAVLGGALGALGSRGTAGSIMLLAFVVQIAMLIMFAVQRSHDMDWNGWSAILVFIPFVNFIWLLNPGTKGRNRYGAPPPPNTLGVKLLGLILPVVALIGIVAAVALPAYSDYVKRAKAAQQLQQPAR